jgi:glycosyltransferase involved in cell wall biosynthesis
MRITIVGPGKRFISGISYYTISLANALAAHHEVSVLLLRELLPRRLFPGAAHVGRPISPLSFSETIAVMDGLDWYWGTTAIKAARFLRDRRPEVLVLPWWTSAVAHSYLLLRLVNALGGDARTVLEFHEVLDPFEQGVAPLRLYVQAARRLLFKDIAAYVAHSRGDLQDVARTYGLDPGKGFVVSLGSYDHYHGQGSRRPQDRDDFTILYFGLIRPYKGVEYLVQAFDALPADCAERLRLVIVGETWEGHNLPARLVAQSRYCQRIEFVNRYVTDREVDEFFARADVACFPYLRASQSAAARIATSYGIPIIASQVGGLAESLAEYEGTLFCEPGNVQQLRDALIEVMRTRRRGFSDPFPWERTVKEYQRVLSGARRPAPWSRSEPEGLVCPPAPSPEGSRGLRPRGGGTRRAATPAADAARSGAAGARPEAALPPVAHRLSPADAGTRLHVERP